MPPRKPKRIQRKRTRGWKAPADALYVGRPTKWGNPFFVIDAHTDRSALPALREKAAQKYERALRAGKLDVSAEDARAELRGRDLICWCPLDQACHADVLLRLANGRRS